MRKYLEKSPRLIAVGLGGIIACILRVAAGQMPEPAPVAFWLDTGNTAERDLASSTTVECFGDALMPKGCRRGENLRL